jgi:Flp pilus assembly pilin Flp
VRVNGKERIFPVIIKSGWFFLMFNFLDRRINRMKALLKRFVKDESGMETIEWVMVGALVVLGFVALWVAFKPHISSVLDEIANELDSAAAG